MGGDRERRREAWRWQRACSSWPFSPRSVLGILSKARSLRKDSRGRFMTARAPCRGLVSAIRELVWHRPTATRWKALLPYLVPSLTASSLSDAPPAHDCKHPLPPDTERGAVSVSWLF